MKNEINMSQVGISIINNFIIAILCLCYSINT